MHNVLARIAKSIFCTVVAAFALAAAFLAGTALVLFCAVLSGCAAVLIIGLAGYLIR